MEAPIFVLFENLLSLSEDDHRRHSLLLLLVALQRLQPSTGYRLLFYVKAASKTSNDASPDQLSLQVTAARHQLSMKVTAARHQLSMKVTASRHQLSLVVLKATV